MVPGAGREIDPGEKSATRDADFLPGLQERMPARLDFGILEHGRLGRFLQRDPRRLDGGQGLCGGSAGKQRGHDDKRMYNDTFLHIHLPAQYCQTTCPKFSDYTCRQQTVRDALHIRAH